jgi:hypothetical protein
MVDLARAGGAEGVALAARCELALLGIEFPTREQLAGAVLRAWHREDVRITAHGKQWQE